MGVGVGVGVGVGAGAGGGAGAGAVVVVDPEQLLAHFSTQDLNTSNGSAGHAAMQSDKLPPGQLVELLELKRGSRKRS